MAHWASKAWSVLNPEAWEKAPCPGASRLVAGTLACVAVAKAAWGWAPLLDETTLLIHEAGHVAGALFGERWTVYGGSVFQLAFPAIFAHHFWRKGQALGFCFALGWEGSAWMALGRYMADARALALPLVGGSGSEDAHDWAQIFERWGLLGWDRFLGGCAWMIGWFLLAAAFCLACRLARRGRPSQPRSR